MSVSNSKLRALALVATEGPWISDDGNIFSKPLSNKRQEMIVAMMNDRSLPHPDRDEDGDHRDDPLGFVASTGQEQPNFQNDEAFIAACSPDRIIVLLDRIEYLEMRLKEKGAS